MPDMSNWVNTFLDLRANWRARGDLMASPRLILRPNLDRRRLYRKGNKGHIPPAEDGSESLVLLSRSRSRAGKEMHLA